MKLSEAIRLGAMLRPQAFFRLFDRGNGGTCAMGAAADAIGALDHQLNCYTSDFKSKRPNEWRSLFGVNPLCPTCAMTHGSVCEVIVCLNNDQRWSREQIADWVETVEATLSTTSNGTPDCDAVPVRPTVGVNAYAR